MTVRLYSDIIIFLTAIFFPGWSFFILGAVASYFLFDVFYSYNFSLSFILARAK